MRDRVLVLGVDDDPNMLRITSRILKKAGYDILTAATGQEGLALAQKHKPDLILLDVVLPDISGLEVCRQIKTDENLVDSHVILISATSIESEEQAYGLENGADGYIARPVSNRELLARVQSMLRLAKAEKALAIKSEELVRSNADLESFAYMASHDLREPLRMVTSYLSLLEKNYQDKLDVNAKEFIHFAVDGARRMDKMIEGLLAYSRIGTSGQEFSLVDCEEILADVIRDCQTTIEDTDAKITHEALPKVMGNKTQLNSLFQNLILNAIKFRSEKPVIISIGVEQGESGWIFFVRDNGIGIAPEYFDRLFNVFQRLHSQAEYPGTGLGLAVCKRIVERHGGSMWVESQKGEGATFYFSIPTIGETNVS